MFYKIENVPLYLVISLYFLSRLVPRQLLREDNVFEEIEKMTTKEIEI